jgi:hypothetical protein
MQEIDLFGQDLKAISPIVSSMSHVNCHYIVDPSLERGRILIGFHGSEKLTSLGSQKIRAIYNTSNGQGVYAVSGNEVFKIIIGGNFIRVGVIETTDTPVQMADSGRELMIVDSVNGYILDISQPEIDVLAVPTEIIKITDEDFPEKPRSVIFNTGRFLVSSLGSGRFYGSDIFDGKSWQGLNFATAETYPDNITSLVNGNFGTFYLIGSQTIEIWYNDGGPDFPYSLMSGGVLNYGSVVEHTAIIRLGEDVIFLGTSQAEGKNFYLISGQSVRNITNPEMSDIIRKLRFPDLYKAIGYNVNSSPIFQVTFTENNKSYFYDGKTGLWGERKSRGIEGHIFELGTYAYGQQFFTSRLDGTIFKLNSLVIKDGEYFQDLEFIGRHTSTGEERFTVDAIQFKMEVGQGKLDDYNQAPVATLSYSKDGGFTWTPEIFGKMGKVGEYLIRLIWRRLGTARDIVFRLKITDLVERKIISAFINLR